VIFQPAGFPVAIRLQKRKCKARNKGVSPNLKACVLVFVNGFHYLVSKVYRKYCASAKDHLCAFGKADRRGGYIFFVQ